MADFVDNLSDAELRTKLCEFGFPVVPITTTTRKVMTKKLKMLIENKNKVNSEGRRSLAKFSSEEESDDEVKAKKEKSRRVTVAAGMLPPVSSKTRKNTRKTETTNSNKDVGEASSHITTETKTRRTTRIIAPAIEADMETGSDSEPEIIEEYLNADSRSSTRANNSYISDTAKPSSSSFNRSYGGTGSSYLSSRSPLGQSPDYVAKPVSSTTYSSTSSRYSSTVQDPVLDNSYDKLNQIRARLSLSTNYDRPTFGTSYERKTLGNSGEGDVPKHDTPFLSNFSKRLSQLSNTSQPKPDYSYKSDIIKEHDANGSSFSNRSYLSRARTRDYPQDFKSSQEKNIFKNNIVSFTLLGIAIAFFIAITFLYMGMRSEQPTLTNVADYKIPHCPEGPVAQPGINCVLAIDTTDAINLMRVLLPELTARAITYQCNDATQKPFMDDASIIDFVTSNYALKDPYEIQKAINNLQVLLFKNQKWGISLMQSGDYLVDSNALESIDQLLSNRHQNKLAMVVLHPDLPWKCIIYNKIYTIISSLFIVALGFSGIFMGQKGYRYVLAQRKQKSDQIFSMVERIIDILQTNAADHADTNYLAVNHVRDMIIPPQDRQAMLTIWSAAVKFLQENESRIRTEIQIVSGEEFHVWRWLGSANISATGSKSWQGQAFETQSGSVNSLPCSPTPCLKIRGIFDERERNFYTVREAVLGKCASKCEILHCEADLSSGCVYLKCSSQAEAAIAYQNLHGWWYDGHLVTVKYLRLERYMQRFPDSPKGPPFLIASTNPPAGNDWSNKDD